MAEKNIELISVEPIVLFGVNDAKLDEMVVSQCNFLFTNYTDIFNKVKKDEIKMETLFEFLNVLKSIEDGKSNIRDIIIIKKKT